MIAANDLPKFTYEQLIHVDRINVLQSKIVESNRSGSRVAFVGFKLTASEVSYLTLHGYRVFNSNTGASVFWIH